MNSHMHLSHSRESRGVTVTIKTPLFSPGLTQSFWNKQCGLNPWTQWRRQLCCGVEDKLGQAGDMQTFDQKHKDRLWTGGQVRTSPVGLGANRTLTSPWTVEQHRPTAASSWTLTRPFLTAVTHWKLLRASSIVGRGKVCGDHTKNTIKS